MDITLGEALERSPSAYYADSAKLSLVGKAIGSLTHSPRSIASQVQVLYLSNNNLKSLDGLSDYEKLKSLSVANNCIRYLGDLRWLRQTPLVEKLFFVGNPVTAMPFYREHVIDLCPHATTIDGKPLSLQEKLDAKSTNQLALNYFDQLRLYELRNCILMHLNKLAFCHFELRQKALLNDSGQNRIGSDILGAEFLVKFIRISLVGGLYQWLQTGCGDMFDRLLQDTAYRLHAARVINMASSDKVHLSSSYVHMKKHWESVLAEYCDKQHKLSFQLLHDTINLSPSSALAVSRVDRRIVKSVDQIRRNVNVTVSEEPPSRVSTLVLPSDDTPSFLESKQQISLSQKSLFSSLDDPLMYLSEICFIDSTHMKPHATPDRPSSSPDARTPHRMSTTQPALKPNLSSASPSRGTPQKSDEIVDASTPYEVDVTQLLFPDQPYALSKVQKQARDLSSAIVAEKNRASGQFSRNRQEIAQQYDALIHRMKTDDVEPTVNLQKSAGIFRNSFESEDSAAPSVNQSLQSFLPAQQEEPQDTASEKSVAVLNEPEIRQFIQQITSSRLDEERRGVFLQLGDVDVQALFQLPTFNFEYKFADAEELEEMVSGQPSDSSVASHPFAFVNVAGIKSMKEMKSLVESCTAELIRQQRAEAHFIARAEACWAAVQAHRDAVVRNVRAAETVMNKFESFLQVYREDIEKAKQWMVILQPSFDKIQVARRELDECRSQVRELQAAQAVGTDKQQILHAKIDEIKVMNEKVSNAGRELQEFMRENVAVDSFLRRQSAMFILKGVMERLNETTTADLLRACFRRLRQNAQMQKRIAHIHNVANLRSLQTHFKRWHHAFVVQKKGQKIVTWRRETMKYDTMMTWFAEYRVAALFAKFELFKRNRGVKIYFRWWHAHIKQKISRRKQREEDMELKSSIVIKRRIFRFLRVRARIDRCVTAQEAVRLTASVHRLQLATLFNAWSECTQKRKREVLDKYTIIVTRRYVNLIRSIFVAWLRVMVICRFFRLRGYSRGVASMRKLLNRRRNNIGSRQLDEIADLHCDRRRLIRGLHALLRNNSHVHSLHQSVVVVKSRAEARTVVVHWLAWDRLFKSVRDMQVKFALVSDTKNVAVMRCYFEAWKKLALNSVDQKRSERVDIRHTDDDQVSYLDDDATSPSRPAAVSTSLADLTSRDRRLCKTYFQQWRNRASTSRIHFLNTINIRARSKRVRMRAVLRFMFARTAATKYASAVALAASVELCRIASGPEGVTRSRVLREEIAKVVARVTDIDRRKVRLQKDIRRATALTDTFEQEEGDLTESIRVLESEKTRLQELSVTMQNEMEDLLGDIASLQSALQEQKVLGEQVIEEEAQRSAAQVSELREENRSLLLYIENYHSQALSAQSTAQSEAAQVQRLLKEAKSQLVAAKRVYSDVEEQLKTLVSSRSAMERDIEELSQTLEYTAKTVAEQAARQESEEAQLAEEAREYQEKLDASRTEEYLLQAELTQLKDELAALQLAENPPARIRSESGAPLVKPREGVNRGTHVDSAYMSLLVPQTRDTIGQTVATNSGDPESTQALGRFVSKVLQPPVRVGSTAHGSSEAVAKSLDDDSSSGSDLLLAPSLYLGASETVSEPRLAPLPISQVDLEIDEVSRRIKNRLADRTD